MSGNVLYIDCVGGIAGDMLMASLIDAGASLTSIQAQLPAVGVELQVKRVERQGAGALLLDVAVTGHDHSHRTWRDVRAIIDSAELPERARVRAHKAFELLAIAEGHVHGVSPDEVEFHEVGAHDAIADICGVALALEDLDIDEVVCSPLPLGRGVTKGAHGLLPLPAPATLALLRGVPVSGAVVPGETVTPTGAALVAALASSFGGIPVMTLASVGCGAGQRDSKDVPNIVRALIGQRTAGLDRSSGPIVLETNLDDLVPEFVPDIIDACLAAGAADAWTTPIVMKRGRPGITLCALVPEAKERPVADVILRHTTALGVRARRSEHRWALQREFITVHVDGHPVSIKLGLLGDEIVNLKPEHRDCVRVAQETGRTVKAVWTSALAHAHDEIAARGA
ncbi:nickel pincer cofactor biosynthesis protein LarC [Smaragdicoccus niigatensis]|uniref:nickel pincer cofactor biosynthesis protein LarC n=1 Tax=Smaragdicoccus niigatensis TaxID=359359 RepID=UPI0003708981|nr:nickel pincer cofactor biosynthesis protein LarC [Smaragdicoccus niigatensis]